MIQARVHVDLRSFDGTTISDKESMKYLGCALYADGDVSGDVARRLGCAWPDFQKIIELWKHASETLSRKLQAFDSIEASQVL